MDIAVRQEQRVWQVVNVVIPNVNVLLDMLLIVKMDTVVPLDPRVS